MPLLKANLAVTNLGGQGDSPYIYLDSLLFKYTDNGLSLVYTFEGWRENNSLGYHASHYYDSVAQTTQYLAEHYSRFYMEYDIVSGDMTGKGADSAVVLQNYPDFGVNKTQVGWVAALLDKSTPSGNTDSMPEYSSARSIVCAAGYDASDIKDGSFGVTDYNYFHNYVTLDNVRQGASLSRCTTMALCNTDNDTTYLSYTGIHTVLYADPKVLAVLASTPYFEDLDCGDLSGSYMDSSTSYSSTTGSGSGSSQSVTISAGVSIGSSTTIFDTVSFGWEVNASYGFTYETAQSSSLNMAVTYSTIAGQDTVVFYSIPMEVYYYDAYYPITDSSGNIVKYDKQTITVNIPHTAAVKTLSLQKYEKIAEDYPALPKISGNVITSTPGDPASYPQSTKGYDFPLAYSGDWSGLDYSAVGANTAQAIDITQENETTYTNSFNVEYSLGGGLKASDLWMETEFSISVNVGVGGDFGKVTTTTVGSSFSGTLYDLPAEAEPYGYYFAWKLFAYTTKIDDVYVPVVSYLVKDVTQPPTLPKDFAQDYAATTSGAIGLSWSYPAAKNVAGFQLYRYYDFPEGNGSYELKFVPASAFTSVTYDSAGRAICHYEYQDTGLSPYTQYAYQIKSLRSAVPPSSIPGAVLTARTSPSKGVPAVTLGGVQQTQVPAYDAEGSLTGTRTEYSLLVYPDAVSTVSVTASGAYTEAPRYQWQKLGDGGWADIKGAASVQYRFSNSGYSDEGQYRCRVNSIYDDADTGQIYYITTYSPVFTLQYAMRQAVVQAFTADRSAGTVSLTLKSAQTNHYFAPTGTVAFHIVGQNYDSVFSAALKTNSADYTSTATLHLGSVSDGAFTANLADGAYKITAFYSGSRVFQALDVGHPAYYVSGNVDAGGYLLNMSNRFTYGDDIPVELLHVYVNSSNQQVTDLVTDGVTYDFQNLSGASVNSFVRSDGRFAAAAVGSYQLKVTVGSKEIIQSFTVGKRAITVGFDHIFYGVYKQSVVRPALSDAVLLKGSYAFSDSISSLPVEMAERDAEGNWVFVGINTDPGRYDIVVGYKAEQSSSNYDVTFVTGTYYILSSRYGMTINAAKLDDEIVGTVGVISPAKVTLSNGTSAVAATTASNNTWSAAGVFQGGMDVVLQAVPQTGYRVVSWTVSTPNVSTTYKTGSGTFVYQTLANDTSITANFGYAQNRLYFAASGPGGTVSPVGNSIGNGAIAQPGATFRFLATPAPGYHFVQWTLSGDTNSNFTGEFDATTGTSATTVTMGSVDTTLTAEFQRDSYTLTLSDGLQASYATVDALGKPVTVTGTGSLSIPGDTQVTVTLRPGYSASPSADWLVNGQSVGTGLQSYPLTMTAATTVQTEVTRNGYTVTVTTAPDGAGNQVRTTVDGIVSELSDTIPGGSRLVFTALPARGYVLDHWTIGGASAGTDPELTLAALSANTAVQAVFAPDPVRHTVTVTAGSNGTLACTVSYTGHGNDSTESAAVPAGGSASLTLYSLDALSIAATPADNFMLRKWTVNDTAYDSQGGNTLSYSSVTQDMSIAAKFIAKSLATLNFSAQGSGQVSGTYNGSTVTSGTTVSNGGALVLTATPDSDTIMVERWTLNGTPVTNADGTPFIGETLAVNPLAAGGETNYVVQFTTLIEHKISWQLANAAIEFKISPESYRGQTAGGADHQYARDGSAVSFTLTPGTGYRVTSLKVDDVAQTPDKNGVYGYSGSSLTEDLSIVAEASWLYSVNAAATPGGSVVLGAQKAVKGEQVTLLAVPGEGYTFGGWTVTEATFTGGVDDPMPPAPTQVPVDDPDATSTFFTMPGDDVDVTAVFTKSAVTTHYDITVPDSEGGDATATPNRAAAGDTVTLNASPDKNYAFSSWVVKKTADNSVAVAVNAPNNASASFTMPAFDVTVTAEFKVVISENGGGGGGGGTITPTYTADVKEGGVKTDTLSVTVDAASKAGTASLNAAKAAVLLDAEDATVVMPSIPGVSAYRLELPASALDAGQNGGALTLTTGFGSVTIPDNMLSSTTGAGGKTVGITVGQGNTSGLSDAEKMAIGNRPLIQLTLTLDGTQTAWNNHDAPVTVSIPYTPTAAELKNSDSIVIWYIDGSGNTVSVPNGHYDAATGEVTFTTTHFSLYAVGYNPVSFGDVPDTAWYHDAVAFLAARGITGGTSKGTFSPDATLTRGQFIVMLMRAYEISPDAASADNFSDAGNTYYTGYLAAAKRLGIAGGVGNNLFAPDKEIARQEMFTLLYNALKAIGQLPQGTSGKTLSDFSDSGSLASWAKDAMALLVETGIVTGSNDKLSPAGTATRAEMAQLLYQLLGK